MARDYWTCPNCGENLDHGEKCDCQKIKKDEKKVIETLKESEIDREIRLAKEEKELNKKVNSLMETLNITEGEGALLTLKYCETAETLREFDYKKNIFEAYRESKNYNKINELNETVNTAKNKIYSTDIEVVTEGYRELAKVYISLEEALNRSPRVLGRAVAGDEKARRRFEKSNELSREHSDAIIDSLRKFHSEGGEGNYQKWRESTDGASDGYLETAQRVAHRHMNKK